VYYPVVALLDGNNPYDTAAFFRTYPVQQEFPPYLPSLLTVHLPFGLLPLARAQVVYFAMTALLTYGFAAVTLLACGLLVNAPRAFGLATLIIVSRPGYWNLAMGQVTVPVAIGTYLALRFGRERPRLAALGLALALLKPTYGAPLSVLLLVRGELPVVLGGGVLAAALSVVPVVALLRAAGGAQNFVASLAESYASFGANPDAGASTSPDRIDAVALLARAIGHEPSTGMVLVIGVAILALGATALRHLARRTDEPSRALGNSIACVALLLCVYHQAYDLLLVALPLTALAAKQIASGLRRRGALLALLGVAAANYLAARPTLLLLGAHPAWRMALTSLNGALLLLAFAVLLTLAWRADDGALRHVGPR
jgi:hypothetical protein